MVFNAGVGGWGTLQETRYARDHFSLLNTDFIIITFCGNDPFEDIMFEKNLTDSEKGILGYFPGKTSIRENSHLYRFISYRFRTLFYRLYIGEKQKKNPQNEFDFQSASIITEEEWNKTLGYLKSFHEDFLRFNPNGILLIQASSPWNNDIRKYLSSISNGESLIYVDLYNETISLPVEQRQLPYDGHWGREMHKISAKKLYEMLETNMRKRER
jgi:hypothetical protein